MTRTESLLDSFGEGFAGYERSNISEDIPRAKMLTEVVVQPLRKTRTIGTAVGKKYSGHQRPLVDRQIFHNGALIGHAQPVWARSGHETGRRLSLFLLGGREKAMLLPRVIDIGPHDLARRGDSVGLGVRGARDIDGREHAPVIEKAMRPRAIEVEPHDLPTRVDSEGFGVRGAGNIDGREGKRSGGLGDVAPPPGGSPVSPVAQGKDGGTWHHLPCFCSHTRGASSRARHEQKRRRAPGSRREREPQPITVAWLW